MYIYIMYFPYLYNINSVRWVSRSPFLPETALASDVRSTVYCRDTADTRA